jgi:hypothetical protein
MFFGICDLVLICICLFHFPHVVDRPRFPFFVEKNGDGIRSGDTLLTWNGERLRIPESAHLLAELSSIGTRTDAVMQRQSANLTRHPSLIPYYPSAVSIIVIFVTGLVTVLIRMFMFYRPPANPTATTLHWTLVGIGVTVMTDWGTISPSSIQTYVVRTLFVLSYMTVAAGFLIFSMQFPRENKGLVPVPPRDGIASSFPGRIWNAGWERSIRSHSTSQRTMTNTAKPISSHREIVLRKNRRKRMFVIHWNSTSSQRAAS